MNCPSLLFNNKNNISHISNEVFKDLKLDQLLSENTLCVMQKLCSPEDIPNRLSLIEYSANKDNIQNIKHLLSSISKVSDYYELMNQSDNQNIQSILFVMLIHYFADFVSKGSELSGKDVFINRFSDFCKSLLKQDNYKQAFDESHIIQKDINSVSSFIITVKNSSFTFKSASKQSLMERLSLAENNLKCNLTENDTEFNNTTEICDDLKDILLSDYPDLIQKSRAFQNKYHNLFDKELIEYKNELSFICEIISLINTIKESNIPLCKPTITKEKSIVAVDAYDITLLSTGISDIIPNDIKFNEDSSFYFLTGANGGGKTTYLRTVGNAVLFALNGIPVPARSISTYPIDNIFTHFPRDDHFESEGRFENEKRRITDILSNFGKCPLILLNETYSTTNEEKSTANTIELAKTLKNKSCFGIYVTHAHDAIIPDINRLMVKVDDQNENNRTYKVVTSDNYSSSFANDILKKYNLTKEQLQKQSNDTSKSEN